MKWFAIAVAAVAVTLTACGGDKSNGSKTAAGAVDASVTSGRTAASSSASPDGASSPAGTPAGTPAASSQTPATAATQTTPNGGAATKTYDKKPDLTIDLNKKYFATIKMDIGDIKIELYPQDAPETVNSFVSLARDGYFDGLTFHRVIPGFVAQGGDPMGTGRGGPGYTIPDEVNDRKFLDGTVGMAKTTAPNSAGSQFFITFTPQPNLDGSYTVFGQIIEGREVLDKIAPRDPARGGPPGTVINTIVIEEQ
jgi:peptidylprolyl isomerase